MVQQRIPYLYEKRGAFYVRIVVPQDLRPFVENRKGEISRLLGHSLKDVKANHARAVASALDERDAARARKAEAEGVALAQTVRRYLPKTADQMTRELFAEELRIDIAERADPERPARMLWSRPTRLADLRRVAAGLADNKETDALVGWAIDEYRQRGNHAIETGTAEWRRLAMSLAGAQIEAMDRVSERDEGDFAGTPAMPVLNVVEPEVEAPGRVVTFEDVIDLKAKRESSGADAIGLPPATVRQFKNSCRSFAAHRKSDNAATVTFEEGEAWIDALRAEGHYKAKTMSGMLQGVRTVLTWGREVRRDVFPTANPLVGVRLPKGQQVPPSERTYTLEEAKAVLRAAQAETDPTLRFIPWIAAYTGARVGEIGKLSTGSFLQVGSDWFIDIRPDEHGRVKTASSTRRVPVHPDLIAHGLVDHVKATAIGDRLFSTRFQPRISEWMRDTVKINRKHLAPNHGFRHLFEDLCTEAGMRDDARSYITGRGTKTSRDKYGRSDAGLPGLARQMALIPTILEWSFDEVEVS